ncbi:DUF3857 domain-containing protein [uncultured Tenacibaculum sp.]|uniref:DUF3857 domain-containing protein n=1 Tax=uncultured Tenacibaculum sp. TaxID=174713 RepID=UPI00262DD504|nr:DUF3857 domain-containing protein [uncultured Tenacibaculum sp.]
MIKLLELKKYNKYFVTVIFFLLSITVYSQYSEEYKKYSKQYPNSRKVRLNQEIIITIKLTGEEFDIKQEFIEEDLYLNESATYGSKKVLKYSSFFELEKISASSFSYEKGKYKESKVKEFKKKDDLSQSFYDDTKALSFIYPNLKKGSKSKLHYIEKVKNPRFISPFYFADYFPIIKNKVTIIVDKGIGLKFKKFNVGNENILFSKKEKRKKTIYKWELKNKNKYDFEDDSPSYKSILPHIIPIITTYKNKKKTKKLLGEVSDLYNWYYSLVENVNKEKPSKELVDIVTEITLNKKSDLEKVKAIYYWTQKNIKYIAFEYALGGFIPRESNDVFRKKYGDCKDNSSILFKMLEIAGLKGNLTWVGTRSIPYSYKEVPTPIVDNHMILTYENNGKTYFLDATGRYVKLGIPTSFIQGKEVLISYGDKFKVKKVPIIAAQSNAVIDSTYIKVLDNNIIGNSKTTISGYPKINYFQELENENSQSKLKEFYNWKLKKGNNKFLIKNFKEIDKYNYDEDFVVNYSFEIDNYFKKLGDEIYFNLNLNKELSKFKTEKKRKTEKEFDYKKYYSFYTVLEIPEGYKVDYLPENVLVSNKLMRCNISFQLKENKIIYNQVIELNFLTLNLEEQKEVNKQIEKIEKSYKEIIVLKK